MTTRQPQLRIQFPVFVRFSRQNHLNSGNASTGTATRSNTICRLAKAPYDRINDYASVKISNLARPQDIRSWSFGEVKKPETINYRTYRPEKDGLFCERIFGPEKDWECALRQVPRDEVQGHDLRSLWRQGHPQRVRRKRMGHIELAAPVVHIWFFKAMPSRLGNCWT